MNNLRIIKSKSAFEKKISGEGIFSNTALRKKINEFYSPHNYLGFYENGDFIPLVEKNGLVTFYGGIRQDGYNFIPENNILINETLNYLITKKYNFRLLSIKNDVYELLDNSNKIFDVPFNQRWIYKNINNFDINSIYNVVSSSSRKKIRKSLKLYDDYNFLDVKYDNTKETLLDIINRQIDSFGRRNKKSGWVGQERLFCDIIDFFSKNYKLIIREISKGGKLKATYFLVYNDFSIKYYFSSVNDVNDQNISFLMFYDMLNRAKQISKDYGQSFLDGMRGSFTYKKRMGFTPVPLYALVKDPSWKFFFDTDLELQETKDLYSRNFGCFLDSKN